MKWCRQQKSPESSVYPPFVARLHSTLLSASQLNKMKQVKQ